MIDAASISAGAAVFNSLKSILNIAKTIRDSDDVKTLRMAGDQMFQLAIEARTQAALFQQEHAAVKAELELLQSEVKKAAEFDAKAQAYKRVRVGGGGFVYVEAAESQADQGPVPYMCPTCFGDQKFTMLQPTRNGSRGEYTCPKCGTEID